MMKVLAKLLLGNDEKISRRNVEWNTMGSFCYAMASMLLTIAVVQMAGADEGGIFAFAFSTFGQHMFMVAYFGMRPFQITDVRMRFTFGEYRRLRIITCLGAVIFSLLYLAVSRYSAHKTAVILLMVLYKVMDGFADVYESEFQRDGRLYLTGKSNTFRTIFSTAVFLGTLAATGRLALACLAADAAQAAGILLFDCSVIRYLPKAVMAVGDGRCQLLFRENIVLFLSVVLDFYVFSASKYAINACMADRYQALFTAIFMPTNVINLVAGFVIRPYVTTMSDAWDTGDPEGVARVVRKIFVIIIGLTVLAMGAAYLLGIPVLDLLYPNLRDMLAESRTALLLIILGGAMNALINLFYYAIIVMEGKTAIFFGYVAAAVLAALISRPFVRTAGILGGAFSYLLLMTALAAFFGAVSVFLVKRGKRELRRMPRKKEAEDYD